MESFYFVERRVNDRAERLAVWPFRELTSRAIDALMDAEKELPCNEC